MKQWISRLQQMLWGWGCVGVIYTLSDRLQGDGYVLAPSRLDQWIPFSPSAVWVYLSFFLLIPAAYFLVPESRLRWLTRAMQLSALFAGGCYLLWPTTMQYPDFSVTGYTAAALNSLMAVDSRQNCFPSLHVALTLLSVWALATRRQWWLTAVSVIWALAIVLSILQLRRHLLLDAAGGTVLAAGCGYLVSWLEKRKRADKGIADE